VAIPITGGGPLADRARLELGANEWEPADNVETLGGGGPAHVVPLRRALAMPSLHPLGDQAALELRHRREDGEQQAPGGARGIDLLCQAGEGDAAVAT
jgi:hypothetical protein